MFMLSKSVVHGELACVAFAALVRYSTFADNIDFKQISSV